MRMGVVRRARQIRMPHPQRANAGPWIESDELTAMSLMPNQESGWQNFGAVLGLLTTPTRYPVYLVKRKPLPRYLSEPIVAYSGPSVKTACFDTCGYSRVGGRGYPARKKSAGRDRWGSLSCRRPLRGSRRWLGGGSETHRQCSWGLPRRPKAGRLAMTGMRCDIPPVLWTEG
jgi:hypothetical protein